MPESLISTSGESVNWTADAAYSAGDIIQLPDGRAGQVTVDVESGYTVGVRVCGILKSVAKTNTFAALAGNKAYWDHSANKVHYKKVNDRDFFLGVFTEDGTVAGTDTTCSVNLNVHPHYDYDLVRDTYLTVPSGTQAVGGFLPPQREGQSLKFNITATSEVQKLDALAIGGFATGANAIVEFAFRIPTGGSNTASDFNIGIANGTHATDADSITNHLFMHLDGASTAIKFQSKDGTTTVAATDSTTTFTAGTGLTVRKEVWFDLRNPADVQIYVDGVNVLPSTVFDISASVATWQLLAHLEKSTGTETADMTLDWLRARLQQ